MTTLSEMTRHWAQSGRVVWIGLRGARRGDVGAVEHAAIGTDGLAGDHGRAGPRAVTLFQQEHLAAVGSYLGRGPVAPEVLRRNLVIGGLNLSALRGRTLCVGEAVLRITVPCAPCSRMEEAFGPGGHSALRGHGGWCAEVLRGGMVALGAGVTPGEDAPGG